MLRIILVRPGATSFSEQGRIKGTLDVPLDESGKNQVAAMAEQLAAFPIEAVYTSPCLTCRETADLLGDRFELKPKAYEKLCNLNLGLWQGRLIDEIKQSQPKLFRRWQEQPETVCPPEGEMIEQALARIRPILDKIIKRHRHGETVVLVCPEPLARIISHFLYQRDLGDLWEAECHGADWETLTVEAEKAALQ